MDTTEQYIKMCEKAKEVQKPWKPQDGDLAWHPNEGADYMGTWEFPEVFSVVRITEQLSARWWRNWLWLPRQGQLQTMVGKGMNSWEGYAYGFGCWCLEYYKQGQLGSLEQLGLAFVMEELYSKTWDGENWVLTDR